MNSKNIAANGFHLLYGCLRASGFHLSNLVVDLIIDHLLKRSYEKHGLYSGKSAWGPPETR